MRRIRVMGLLLVAALALAAFGASSASALPEIGRCVAKTGGKYKNSNCTEKVTSGGTFEFVKGANKKPGFTATSGEAVLEGASGTKIVCKASTAVGKYDEDGTTFAIKGVESVVATFTTCEDPGIGKICHSSGQAEGTIVTEVLEGELRYLTKTTKPPVVVQELHPTSKKAFAIFECGLPAQGGIKVTVEENKSGAPGSKEGGNCILSTLSEVNVMAKTVKDIYKGKAGVQEPQKYEGQAKICNLETEFAAFPAPFERSTQTETAEVVSEETVEIKA
ncbi:MAG TPA: hypothetical protein VNZ01_02905 [Solirubrobacteraceae bacterium]|jgi:hypothetical protein|nr:hypothetical protein [Solirubrobacteraceae bacterium]